MSEASGSRWRRVEELFHAASELPAGERDAYLAEACGGDEDLSREVRGLLEASPGSDGVLDALVRDAVGTAAAEGMPPPWPRLGPWRLGREIGRGGLATVFLGERDDGDFRMRAAVKVVRPGMATRDVLERFRQERQILANLRHPYIARLLDGGTTPDGLPYFVLEHVDGEPIDRWCDARRLGLEARLRLFLKACDAVAYAHRNLVVHRDLKPSNLLVTAEGEPRLLDFGIARILDADAVDAAERTITGMRLLTPEYASPEQVRGEPLTTATDVYSAGVLLYRLLTGEPPYRFASRRPQEVERVVCTLEPPPPSAAVRRRSGDAKLARRLAGDLDKVLLMALRKEAPRRYASVEKLAEDVRRFLELRPVEARRDTFTYRAGKLVRRHRGWVAAAAALLASLVGGLAATAWQAREATRQQARAEETAAFLIDLFEVSDPSEARGNEIRAREILDRGAERVRREMASSPDLQAALMGTIGRVYRNLGLYGESAALLEEALALRREAHGDDDPEVARDLNEMADLHHRRGEYDQAEALYRQALELDARLLGEGHPQVGTDLRDLGITLLAKDRLQEAETVLRRALELHRRQHGEEHAETADSANALGQVLYGQGRFDEAEALFRPALASQRRARGDEHPEVVNTLNNLAAALDARGRPEAAEPLLRQALELRRRVLGDEHTDTAASANNLAAVLAALGRYDEAEPLYREALAVNRQALGDGHPDVAGNLRNLAWLLEARGDPAAAEPLYREALAIEEEALGRDHSTASFTRFDLARVLVETGRDLEEAEALLRESVRVQRRSFAAGDWRPSYPMLELGGLLCDRGRYQEGEALLREASALRQALGEDSWELAEAENRWGACLAALGRVAEAEPLLVASREALAAQLGDDHWLTETADRRLAELSNRR